MMKREQKLKDQQLEAQLPKNKPGRKCSVEKWKGKTKEKQPSN